MLVLSWGRLTCLLAHFQTPFSLDAEDIARILLAARSTPPRPVEAIRRVDLPLRRRYASASFDAALQAVLPQNRKRSLDDLDDNLLARSSTRPMEARVKAWQKLCEAWDVKEGDTHWYRVNFHAFWYQEKEFGLEVEPIL